MTYKGDYMNELGNYLKELRGGKSLREAAKQIGISHTYLDTIEKGYDKRSKKPVKPTPETLRMISNTYNVSFNELMIKAGYITSYEINHLSPNSDLVKPGVELVKNYSHLQHNLDGKKVLFDDKQDLKNYYDSAEKHFDQKYTFRFLDEDFTILKKTLKSYQEKIRNGLFEEVDIEKYVENFINNLFLKDKLPVIENLTPGTSLLDEINITDYQLLPSPLKNGIIFIYKVSNDSFSHKRIHKNDLLIVDGNIDDYFNGDMVLVIRNKSELLLKELIVRDSEEVYLSQPNTENIKLTDEYYVAGKIIRVIFEP
jgi:SOS-response transcriptional repressor LexA